MDEFMAKFKVKRYGEEREPEVFFAVIKKIE
jgi:hypothetical protein